MQPPKLPKDLTKITEGQYRSAVCYLAQKPLRALEKRHRIIEGQERRAQRKRDAKALKRLDVLERITRDALFEHQFGPAICYRRRRKRRR